jgi:hemerythrin
MADYIWDSRYELGVPELDAQHRKYFMLRQTLRSHTKHPSSDAETTQSVLTQLLQHAQDHFQTEENLMAKMRYPEVERHRHIEAHNAFVDRVNNLAQRQRTSKDAREELTEFVSG